METLLSWGIATLVLLAFVMRYWIAHRQRERDAKVAAERAGLISQGPMGQHPHIQTDACIGCGGCIQACPEGDVLGLIDGKAAIVKGHKCIGHGLCAEECPVGAITMVLAPPSASVERPFLTAEHETNIRNLFIAGELGGLALIKNAVNEGRACIDTIASRLRPEHSAANTGGSAVFDVIIVGAGPAGISASLRAAEHGLSALTLERETVGGTVSKYPREKLVMTSPVEFPLYGKMRSTQLSKEELLAFWRKVMQRADLNIRTGECVEGVRMENGIFRVKSARAEHRSRSVVLALGRAGTPRKLGVPGEELPHVLYRLIEAEHYTGKRILIVGGGDSAVEAAMGLAHQPGNRVTISYRRDTFSRLKDRNEKRILEQIREGRIEVLFNSMPTEFLEGSTVLECAGEKRAIANDFVWIFAGGTPPKEFLSGIGIEFANSNS